MNRYLSTVFDTISLHIIFECPTTSFLLSFIITSMCFIAYSFAFNKLLLLLLVIISNQYVYAIWYSPENLLILDDIHLNIWFDFTYQNVVIQHIIRLQFEVKNLKYGVNFHYHLYWFLHTIICINHFWYTYGWETDKFTYSCSKYLVKRRPK